MTSPRAFTLSESIHPNPQAQALYSGLVGIEDHKIALRDRLVLALEPRRLDTWRKKHHPKGLGLLDRLQRRAPLILLSGEVGCGKSALASCIATPVAELIDRRIQCFETPSDIRGGGLVGGISDRITAAFAHVQRQLKSRAAGILIIDEADDLATSRAQMQAHHEDRAGLNVLIKQLDAFGRAESPLAVLLITNRADVIDAAVMRRAMLHLRFERPDDEARRAVFSALLDGVPSTAKQVKALVDKSRKTPAYSYSDLVQRVGESALMAAWQGGRPLSVAHFVAALDAIEPSPLLQTGKLP